MTTGFDMKRLRSWEIVLTVIALSVPVGVAVWMPGGGSFIPAAVAQDMQRPDTSRLVSIGGSITEIIYALGEEARLVGRDSTSLYPQAALALPDVGYMRQLSPEGVMAMDPSAVIAEEGSGPPEALIVLKQSGVAYETVPETHSSEGILDKIRTVGTFLGVEAKADALAASIKADLDASIADAAARPDSERKRVLFILSNQGGKIMASGAGTAADAIIALAGAINSTGSIKGYKPVSDEAIIEAAPDVILMMDRSGSHAASDADLLAQPAIRLTPAGKTGTIIRMDGLELLGFGPRTAAAIRKLNRSLYADPADVAP